MDCVGSTCWLDVSMSGFDGLWLWSCRLQAADAHYISRWTTDCGLDDLDVFCG